MTKKRGITGVVVASVAVVAGAALAASTISRHVVGGGGGRLTAPTHTLIGTAGQPVVGRATGATHLVAAGFWAGQGAVVGVAGAAPEAPKVLALGASLPNPATRGAWIPFDLPAEADVTIDISSVTGRTVRVVWSGTRPAGRHRLEWDGRDAGGRPVANGVYFYRLRTGGKILERKLAVVH